MRRSQDDLFFISIGLNFVLVAVIISYNQDLGLERIANRDGAPFSTYGYWLCFKDNRPGKMALHRTDDYVYGSGGRNAEKAGAGIQNVFGAHLAIGTGSC